MPVDLNVLRNQLRTLAGSSVGLSHRQRRSHAGQQGARGIEADILALPVDAGDWYPMQVLDATSPDFGAMYFIPDFHAPDDPSHPVR